MNKHTDGMYHKLDSWDIFYLQMCVFVSGKSKDPSTKVGAVIVRPDRTVASIGFNGFPRGVKDLAERLNNREQKYPRIVHAEMNAILSAREPLLGYSLYVSPISPCATCAGAIIQSGIKKVFAVMSPSALENWTASAAISNEMFDEAGVFIHVYDEVDVL